MKKEDNIKMCVGSEQRERGQFFSMSRELQTLSGFNQLLSFLLEFVLFHWKTLCCLCCKEKTSMSGIEMIFSKNVQEYEFSDVDLAVREGLPRFLTSLSV